KPSRLVFKIPPDVISIPYSFEGLTDWSRLEPHLASIADSDDMSGSSVREPATNETAIELPYRLFVSPDERAKWKVSADPARASNRVPLWHAQLLAPEPDGGTAEPKLATLDTNRKAPVRAIWSPDYVAAGGPPPSLADTSAFLSSLSSSDRDALVRITA